MKKSKNAKGKKGKLLAEAHSRNTIAFMPLVFCLVVMVVILKDNYSRFFSIYRKTIGIGLLVLIQSLVTASIYSEVLSDPSILLR